MERRYGYVKGLVKECSHHQLTLDERTTFSDTIDKIVTHRFWGIPLFLICMYMLFSFVFMLGEPVVEILETGFTFLSRRIDILLTGWMIPDWIHSLIIDGILAGVSSVLVFLPYILLLFLGISFLEETGYLSRAAFIMDRVMHALGLHGKSFIPLLLGFGCNVPAIMAARTLDSPKDRIVTILVIPLMSCSARLPVYTLFTGALFKRQRGLILFSLYLIGIMVAIMMARLFKKIFFAEETVPLVIELPPYRVPSFHSIIHHVWFMAWLFIRKAATLICAAVIICWLLASMPFGVPYASEQSILGQLGAWIAPLLKPAGFGFWQAAVALLFGLVAKESVVSTLAALYGVQQEGLAGIIQQHFTPVSAYAFLIMILIYMPCVATIAVIKQETNIRWALFTLLYTILLGWILSVIIYQIGSILF